MGGGGLRRRSGLLGVPPSPGPRWCPAVSPAPCASSSPAAAASFPGTEPSSLPPLLFSDLGRGGGGLGGREQQTADIYSSWLKDILPLIISTQLTSFILLDGCVASPDVRWLHYNYSMMTYLVKFTHVFMQKKTQ